ncbi:MAG: alkaline phosphatase family protein [Bacteroidetes bacterium]|nr:alkaline phosphatase family protein [Bacteroidota bacterium]
MYYRSLRLLSIICLAGAGYFFSGFSTAQVLWCERPFRTDTIQTLQRIAFGSCAHQKKQEYILADIARLKPDLMVYLGDNIYADTRDMKVMREKYGVLSCKDEFRSLVQATHIIATWDDHDYGQDDAGAEYPMKKESKDMFLEFWNEPKNSDRYRHDGIYASYYYGDSAHRVQVILLDLRTFRSPLIGRDYHYQANSDTNAVMLGAEQWAWLRKELQRPARIRIIGSSTQFCTDHNGWETWSNFPHEQERMMELIRQTRAEGVVFISGDVHYAELSVRRLPGLYPIYDMTASGLTQVELRASHNPYRIGPAINTRNFGMIDIDWRKSDPELLIRGFDFAAKERIVQTVKLSELKFSKD